MECYKLSKKIDGQESHFHLVALSKSDLEKLSSDELMMQFSINGNRVSIAHIDGTRDEITSKLKALGANEQPITPRV